MTAELITGGVIVGIGCLYVLVASGRLTPRFGVGRSVRPLGPIVVRIRAPREVVADVIRAPYSERAPRDVRHAVKVLEREPNRVLAEHRTHVRPGLVSVTVEWVTFEWPDRIDFELVRGPVPYVVEEFVIREAGSESVLEYRGQLGADLWIVGRWWGDLVARRWDAAVRASLQQIARSAEERAEARHRRGR